MYSLLRSFLFLLSAENAHYFTTSALKFLLKIPGTKLLFSGKKYPTIAKEVMGIKFPNPVGLAAGFDKNADYLHEMGALGFGFVEIGTVTPKGQPGNPKPRLFRLKSDQALINRMGFNNHGVDIAIEKLKQRPGTLIVGGNIGKNKVTPNEQAVEDYLVCFQKMFDHVDYFVVNVSSPNTPNLRDLQEKEPLKKLLGRLQEENDTYQKRKPILLKIAPDLTDEQLDDILEIVETTKIEGVIATNTTIQRTDLNTSPSTLENIGAGGLSGKPLSDRSTEVVKYLRQRNTSMVLIGVGGIMNAQDAISKLNAGADLVQLYTGFIYGGPKLIQNISRAIANNIDRA